MGGAATAQAGEDTELSLGLRAELEYVDVEGPGGFSNRDANRIAPSQRAPYVDLDKATVDFLAGLRPWLSSRLELRGDSDSARFDRAYLTATPLDIDEARIDLELGRQKPAQRPPPRKLETWSPQGAVFWRGREWHAAADARYRLGPVDVRLVPSAAMQRELDDESMGEDPSLPTTAFGDSEVEEDATLEVGGLVGVGAYGASVAGFAFVGKLLDNSGPDRLTRTFDDYALLGDTGDRTSRWYGARAAFDRFGIYVFGEAIFQQLGLIDRNASEVGVSYTVGFDIHREHVEVEPMVRYGQISTTNLPEVFDVPESWDRQQWVYAVLIRPLESLELKFEYLALDERAGTSAEGETKVDDDQVLVQLRFETEVQVQ